MTKPVSWNKRLDINRPDMIFVRMDHDPGVAWWYPIWAVKLIAERA